MSTYELRLSELAVVRILVDLLDRRGIKSELDRCDEDVKREIARKLTDIVEGSVREYDDGRWFPELNILEEGVVERWFPEARRLK